jgi:hypothetical protein
MELTDIVQVLSNSLKEANKQIGEKSKNEMGYAAVDFSISFPADFKIENKKAVLNFVDMKTQAFATSTESTTKKWFTGLFGSEKRQVIESSNVAMINIKLKPMPG